MHSFLARLKQGFAELYARRRKPSRRELSLGLAAIPALFCLYVLALVPFTPSIIDITKAKAEQPARVYSADGQEIAVFKRVNRQWVKLDQISPHVIDALIAAEDHRFYQHHGIDFWRTAGAAVKTFSGSRQGGSTITQQLARNLFPEEIGRAPTLTRKIKEAITALKIEMLYSKREILETYLNTVPFLYNAYGIEMAARTYYGTSADSLDVLQSATLVGMLKGNAYYNPVINPERALKRRNTVLAQMVEHDKLGKDKFAKFSKKPLDLDFERQAEDNGPAAHFAQQVRKFVLAWADRNGYDIYADGIVVRTTLDSRLQKFANQAVAKQAAALQGIADGAWSGWSAANPVVAAILRETQEYQTARDAGLGDALALKRLAADREFMRNLRKQKTRLQVGFLALDPRNGQVKAWVGSRDYSQDGYDHVQQAQRQPGSTFKPFVYGAAFAKGMKPSDTFIDKVPEIKLPGGEIWSPSDGGEPSGEPMSLRDGIAYSKNTITAQVMQNVGPERVIKLAQAMGVRQSKLEAVPSLALGTSPVTLKEMVAAYATLANSGNYIEPTLVTRIEDSKGNVLEEFATPDAEKAMEPNIAYTLLDVMRGVIDRGTGTGIRYTYGITADVAGKTGTTQDNTDGWFILMQPQLVAGAWVGFNDNRITLRSNYWGQGAHSALPIVGSFFQQSLNAKLIDPKIRFVEMQEAGWISNIGHSIWDKLKALMPDWLQRYFGPEPKPKRVLKPREVQPQIEPPQPVEEEEEETVDETPGDVVEETEEEVKEAPAANTPAKPAPPAEKPAIPAKPAEEKAAAAPTKAPEATAVVKPVVPAATPRTP